MQGVFNHNTILHLEKSPTSILKMLIKNSIASISALPIYISINRE